MVQNRKKIIELYISNMANSILHKVLEKAIEEKEISVKYHKEIATSLTIARRYREKIHPIDAVLPKKDSEYIRQRITKKVLLELNTRIAKGYKNIDLGIVDNYIQDSLKESKVI